MSRLLHPHHSPVLKDKKKSDEFLFAFQQALKYFPELASKQVFIYQTSFFGIQHASRAYPPLLIPGHLKSRWIYPIVINKRQEIKTFLKTLSEEQKIGLIAHELSHTLAYSRLSTLGVLLFAMKYAISKEFVRKIERETDLRVIKRGAGKFLFLERIAVFKFRENKPYPETEDTYISPVKILANLKKYPNLYHVQDLRICAQQLQPLIKDIKSSRLPFRISTSRKIKHSLKTIIAFFPEVFKTFYLVLIKKPK